MNPRQPLGPRHENLPPRPPMPSHISGDTAPTPPPGVRPTSNDSLAPPFDVVPDAPHERPVTRPTQERVGVLAIGRSTDPEAAADSNQDQVIPEAAAAEPLPSDTSTLPETSLKPGDSSNTKAIHAREANDSPFEPPAVGEPAAELPAAGEQLRSQDQEPGEAAKLPAEITEPEGKRKRFELQNLKPGTILNELPTVYRDAIEELGEIIAKPYSYFHTQFGPDPSAQEKGAANATHTNYFWAFHSGRREDQRLSHYAKLRDAGSAIARIGENAPELVVSSARIILRESAELIKAIVPVQESPLSFPTIVDRPGTRAVFVKRILQEMDKAERPPEVANYMRLAIPRFAWYAHTCPTELVPEKYQEQLRQHWTPRNVRDANYLIHPDEIAEGKAPLHKAVEATYAVAADGYPDEAYAIRSRVIATALRNDIERHEREPDVFEAPYFQFLFAGSITGEVGGAGPGSINYAAICEDVMNETWDRFAAEAREGVAGPATNFLREVTEIHNRNEDMVPFLGRSLTQKRITTNHDIPAVIHGLEQFQVEHSVALTRYVTELPNRPVLTNSEATALAAEYLQSLDAIDTSASASQALVSISGEADMYGFRTYIAETDTSTVLVTGDVDATTQVVHATIEYRSPGSMRRLPITVDLASGTVIPETVDRTPLDTDAATYYRAAIETAITKEVTAAEAKAAEMAALAARQSGNGLQLHSKSSNTPVAPAERQTPRLKTRGEADPELVTETVPDTAEDIAEAAGHIQLQGVKAADISDMLKMGQVNDISPNRVLERIHDKVAQANQAHAPIGKHTRLIGVKETDRSDIKIRQINWVIEGGRQIRIYLEVLGNGAVRVCGVYDKKGDQHQNAYLKKLAKSIHNRSRSGSASGDTPQSHGRNRPGQSKNSKKRR